MDDKYWSDMGDKAAAGGTQASGQKVNLHRASKLMGQNVQDKGGQEVGEIRDILLTSDRGKIQHIVIDVKGAGDARIEPKQLSLGTGDKLMVNLSADELKKQAGKAGKQAKREDKGASTGGTAAGSATAGAKSFSELDKDNDGTLSQMEASGDANAKSNFEKLDKNNDKKLSREEWQAGQGAAAGATGSTAAKKDASQPKSK
jgi:sporulation protein YlmC with PRC-barrel domain